MRSGLVILGVAIAVATAMGMVAILSGLGKKITDEIRGGDAPIFTVSRFSHIDDGSNDATAAEIHACAREYGPFRLLSHPDRRGQSTAIYNGIRAAKTELVVVLDGDLQNDPADIAQFLATYAADADRDTLGLLIGHRVHRRDSGLRKLSSRIANSVRARVLHDATPDTGCGLKLVKRSLFMRLPYFDHMHRFLPALVQRAGARVCSHPPTFTSSLITCPRRSNSPPNHSAQSMGVRFA